METRSLYVSATHAVLVVVQHDDRQAACDKTCLQCMSGAHLSIVRPPPRQSLACLQPPPSTVPRAPLCTPTLDQSLDQGGVFK